MSVRKNEMISGKAIWIISKRDKSNADDSKSHNFIEMNETTSETTPMVKNVLFPGGIFWLAKSEITIAKAIEPNISELLKK